MWNRDTYYVTSYSFILRRNIKFLLCVKCYLSPKAVYQFPLAAVKNYHKLGSLKLTVWEVRSPKGKVSGGLCFFCWIQGRIRCLAFSSFQSFSICLMEHSNLAFIIMSQLPDSDSDSPPFLSQGHCDCAGPAWIIQESPYFKIFQVCFSM